MPKGERPLESGDDVVVQFARDLRLLREKAGSPSYRELSARVHYSAAALSEAASGRKLPSLPVTMAYVGGCGGDTAEWEARWRKTAAELTASKAETDGSKDDGRAPYVGLAAFQQEDADRFFGRDMLVTDLLTRVQECRFLGVFGASGCGKSSLLRAGLAARLAAERGQDRAPVVVFTPGQHPIEECAIQLARFLGESPGTLRDEFTTDPRNLHLRIRQAATDSRAEFDVVLVVDQFEELFTLCTDEQERTALIDALVTATTDSVSRARVVLGVRADFLGHCGQHPSLVTALQDAQVLVGPMTTDELRLAITGPAQQAGYRVETALVARLVADAGQQSGMLPLVSHALLQTWQRRQGPVMTLAGYDAVGGIEHALARTAEQTYQSLDPDQQDVAQQIFLRLTALGEGTEDTKRRVSRDELDHRNPNTAPVLDTLTRARLITVGHDNVEIAHEALIRHWPRLRGWLADDRDGHRLHRQLTDATTEWKRHQRDESLLYRGTPLAVWQNRRLDLLNGTERAFLSTSRRAVERERTARVRRLRWSLVAMGVVVVVVSLLAGLALMQTSRVAEERDIAFSRQLATSARNQLQVDPELALLLAIKAVEVKPTVEADAVLRQAMADSRALATLQSSDNTMEVVVSPDGHRIVTGDREDGSLRVWEKPERGGTWSARRALLLPNTRVWHPVFSPDGRYLAALTSTPAGDTVQVWDLNQAKGPVTTRGQFTGLHDLVFSKVGRQMVVVGDDGAWRLDPTSERDPVFLAAHVGEYTGRARNCVLGSDGRFVACAVQGATVIEDLTGQQEPVKLLNEQTESWQLPVFSPDGRRLAKGNQDGTVQVWDITDGRELAVLRIHTNNGDANARENSVNSVEFSPDGHSVVSTGSDGTVRITNARSDFNSLALRGHQSAVWAATFSPDGRWIASVGSDGTLRLWSAAPGEGMTWRGHTGAVRTAVFTPDGSHIVSGGQDGTVRIWNRDGTKPAVVQKHSVEVSDVDVSPNGRLIASVSWDGELQVSGAATGNTLISEKPDPERQFEYGYKSVEFVADGSLITGNNSSTIHIWNIDGKITRRRVSTIDQSPFEAMAVSPDGAKIAVSYENTPVRIRRLNGSGAGVDLPAARSVCLAFSHDGKELATGEDDGVVRIWPVDSGDEPSRLFANRNMLTGVTFSPNGQYLAASSSDGTVRIWDITGNSEPVMYRGYQASVETVTFSPDGRHLLTAHDDGTVRTQQCDTCGTTQQTLELARSRTTRQLTANEKETFGLTRE